MKVTDPGLSMTPPVMKRLLAKVGAVAALTGIYLLLDWLSFLHEYRNLPVTPWNPGLGIVFAVMVKHPAQAFVALFAGLVLAEWIILPGDENWMIILPSAFCVSSIYAAAAQAVRRTMGLDLVHLKGVARLLVIGTVAAGLAAAVLIGILIISGRLTAADAPQAIFPLIIGDIIGLAVFTPLVLRFWGRWPNDLALIRGLLPELSITLGAIVLFDGLILSRELNPYKFFYLLFVPVVFAAIRRGLDGACFSLAALQFGIVGVLERFDYDVRSFADFQILMLALSVIGLIMGATITERRHTDAEAERMREALRLREQEVAQASRFTVINAMASAVAHELNQPLTAARAMARSAAVLLGRDEAADAARIAENIAQSVGHIDHAAAILQNIRSFLAKGAPEKAPTDMRLLVQQVMSLVSRQQNMAQGRLQGAFDEALPELQCDALQIQQVLINLVQNAIDADAAANIELSVRRGTEGLLFRVQDNGPGIEEGLRDRIFDPLLTSRKHGLGLGLPICRAIIEAHDGRLWLESTRPGRTVFCFTLPT